ncbi:hypothetical protein L226DRAFT_576905 [Lentinus tigrinus ALCF2SS1-7]|uniref:Uncharacterized protein n=1 Tax=Lentinus tigrinus ALCF2SS1-6 TaxID=1328759 RepID=A0A5C2S4Y0_9APHY|nr:hypothetical protein L227DRAFT_564553 [Lentinus tigrinus ALCF2SS1-6]RPD67823.1 hypothetical protein L226DRAFT_474357 [Lentinus tigrinus ALCF2SS1-7]RPD67839.1 hypothetical protein L226DRAFT_576905 [Lentinus tigrinus ALCF2SS1-7]
MLFSLTTLALALLGTVQATPVAPATSITPLVDLVSADEKIPVLDLTKDSVSAHPNATLGTMPGKTGGADQIYPASLFFCRSTGCGSCTGYDLSIQPHDVCLTPGFNFVSMFISQPSNEGLPFAIYTGPSGCASFAQVPVVNTCYNAVNYIGWDFELIP